MDNELKQQKKQKRQTENKYATLINQNFYFIVLIFSRICGKAFRICSLLATLLEVTRIFYIL